MLGDIVSEGSVGWRGCLDKRSVVTVCDRGEGRFIGDNCVLRVIMDVFFLGWVWRPSRARATPCPESVTPLCWAAPGLSRAATASQTEPDTFWLLPGEILGPTSLQSPHPWLHLPPRTGGLP